MKELTGYYLSPQQKNVWRRQREKALPPGQLILSVSVVPAVDALKAAIAKVIAQDTVFRTTYPYSTDPEQAIQIVHDTAEFLFFDVSIDEVSEREAYAARAAAHLFDLENGPMIRVDLVRGIAVQNNWLIVTLPALCADSASMQILAEELLNNTDSETENIPYLQYAEWQGQLLEAEDRVEGIKYWNTRQLPQQRVQLPFDEDPENTTAGLSASHTFDLSGLDMLTLMESPLLESYLGLCWQLLLWLFTDKSSIVTEHVNSGRDFEELNRTMGLLSVHMPVYVLLNEQKVFSDLLREYQQVLTQNDEHKYFYHLRHHTTATFPYLFEFLNRIAQLPEGAEFIQQSIPSMATKLHLRCIQKAQELQATLQYDPQVFSIGAIELIAQVYNSIVRQCVQYPNITLGNISLLESEALQSLLSRFNDVVKIFPRGNKTVDEVFEEQVRLNPEAIALVAGNRQLSYAVLNERAVALATYLCETLQVQAGDRVAVLCGENENMIIAMLGVIKAGAAYVPVDPSNPEDRLQFIMTDSAADVLLTETALAERITFYQGSVVHLDTKVFPAAQQLSPRRQQDTPLYVIYTSGTTGTPKGVVIPDSALVNYICWLQEAFGISPDDRSVLLSSYAFDLGYTSIWGTLLNGGCLYLLPDNFVKEATGIVEYLADNGITFIKTTPSLLNIITQASNLQQISGSRLRLVLTGGEVIRVRDLELLVRIKPDLVLVNHYGPTETTIGTVATVLDKELFHTYKVFPVIGKPISNSYISILDAQLNPVAPGITGELCISGPGLAKGYLNRDALTSEKFIPHPFKAGMLMYRTGDQAKWMPDGNILFTGRGDDQVKIRGYRVELGEVESVLKRHSDVEGVIVVARTDQSGEKELVAYIRSSKTLTAGQLHAYSIKALPVYMIPAHFVRLSDFPLTANGKIDRKKLPDPHGLDIQSGADFVAPRNETEQHLVMVYEEVLKKKGIGIKDDFFVLGGDSIKSIQIVSLLKQRGYLLTIQDVLLHPQIESLSGCVKAATRTVSQETVTGMIPLSPAQKAFFERATAHRHHYNQSVLLHSQQTLSEGALRAALEKIFLHHDALRMVFRETGDGWIQENKGAELGYSLEVISVTDEAGFIAACENIQAGINLEEGPLCRVALFHGEMGDRLLLVIHHLVTDGVSWRILLEDLSTLYQQYQAGKPLQLPAKTDAFKYWQEKLVAYAASGTLSGEDAYWSGITAQEVQQLPMDHVGGSNLIGEATTLSFELDEYNTDLLLTGTYKAYRTDINDILITALGLAVQETCGIEQLLLKLEGHGREPIGTEIDVTRTIGWFTTHYPVVFDLSYSADPIRQLIEVKETLHRIPAKGIGYGILHYLSGKKYNCKPEITFNYLGDFSQPSNASVFEFSGDYHGRNTAEDMERNTVLEVSGMVTAGRMSLSLSYSPSQYHADTVNGILDAYKKHLYVLIEKLSTGGENITPVDLTYKGLSVEQLQQLNEIL